MAKKDKQRKQGFSLIEVMVSALVIAMLVVGGAATMHYTGSSVVKQGNKRIALEIANERLEFAKAGSYLEMAPPDYDEDDKFFLKPSKDDPLVLVDTVSKAPESITVGDHTCELSTTVLRHSQAGSSLGFGAECLEVRASVEFGGSTDETVELTTLILPPWATLEE